MIDSTIFILFLLNHSWLVLTFFLSWSFYSYFSLLTFSSYAACLSAFFRYSSFFLPFKLSIVSSRVLLELLFIFRHSFISPLWAMSFTDYLNSYSVIFPENRSSYLALIMQLTIITRSIDCLLTILLNLNRKTNTYCKKNK